MKKLIGGAAIVMMMAAGANMEAEAQEGFAIPASVEANHSVTIDLLGIHYAYEHPLGRTGTIIGRAGLNFGAASEHWRTGTMIDYHDNYWMMAPSLEIEPRWYYGIDRREGKGRNTDKNQGSFLALKVQNYFPGYVSSDYVEITGGTMFVPAWGLRRVWRERWLMEFTAGYGVGFAHKDRWWGDDRLIRGVDINLRFGVAF